MDIFIKVATKKFFSMMMSFIFTGCLYVLMVGIEEGFSNLFSMEPSYLFIMGLMAVTYISPIIIFLGIPLSLFVDFIEKKEVKKQPFIEFIFYILLTVLVAIMLRIALPSDLRTSFVVIISVGCVFGFWFGKRFFYIVMRVLKEKGLIKFNAEDMK